MSKNDGLKTKLVGVTIPQEWYDAIYKAVEPFAMVNVQDYIREAIEERLREEKRIKWYLPTMNWTYTEL